VGRRCKANDVVAVLGELTSLYPAPAFIRLDNGPEFIAHALKRWNESSGTTKAYIEPGSPWQNGFAEYFNGLFRDEFLNTELITTAPEAQLLADRWRCEYNTLSCCISAHSHCAWTNEGCHVSRSETKPIYLIQISTSYQKQI